MLLFRFNLRLQYALAQMKMYVPQTCNNGKLCKFWIFLTEMLAQMY